MSDKKKSTLKVILRYGITAIVAVGIVLLITNLIRNRETTVYLAPEPAVRVGKPYVSDVEVGLSFSGYLEARSMVAAVPLVQGTILEYPVKAGATVRKDEVLAEIDPEPYRLQKAQAEAAWLAAESTLERLENLRASGSVSEQEYDQVKAQRDAYKAQTELADLQLSYATVKAPVAGTVLMADQSVGNVAVSTNPIAVIADLDDMVVKLSVPEKYYGTYRVGSKGTVTVPATGAVIPCTVTAIAPYVDGTSKTFKMECSLEMEKNDGLAVPGMFVRVNVISESYPAAHCVERSVLTGTERNAVHAYLYEDGEAKFVEFTPVALTDYEVVLPESLWEADFITDGQNSVFDGTKVRVVE